MVQPAPPGLSPAGQRLWRELARHLDFDEHERRVLLEACRCADRLERLDQAIRTAPLLDAEGKVSPLMVEARQQQVVLAKLLASLRLPEDLDNPRQRPQRRSGSRGIYAGYHDGRNGA